MQARRSQRVMSYHYDVSVECYFLEIRQVAEHLESFPSSFFTGSSFSFFTLSVIPYTTI